MRKLLFVSVALLTLVGIALAEENVTVGTGTLNLSGYVQTGFYMNTIKTTPPSPAESIEISTNTFSARSARFKLSTEIVEKIVGGVFEYDFVDSGLREAYFWVSPQFEPLKVVVGRQKLPWLYEYQVSSAEQLWIDRSIIAAKLPFYYDYGAKLDLNMPFNEYDMLKAQLMISNGYNTDGQIQATDFDSDVDEVSVTGGELNVTSKRTDLKDIGLRAGYQFTAFEGCKLFLGAATLMNKATVLNGTILTTAEENPITADLGSDWCINNGGTLGVRVSYTMDNRKVTNDVYSISPTDPTQYVIATQEDNNEITGLSGGLAYFIPIDGAPLLTGLEPAVRYSSLTDNAKTTEVDGTEHGTMDTTVSEITAGLNLYFLKHYAKWQINYVMQSEEDTPYAEEGGTWVKQDSTKIDTSKIQLQFQVRF